MGDTVGPTAAAVSVSAGPVTAGAHLVGTNGLRLTPKTLTPVPIGNFTDLLEIFWTPFKSTAVALISAGIWHVRNTAEIAIAVNVGHTALIPVDMFAFWDGAAVSTEKVDWTNATTRVTALARQDGVWTKAGDTTRRYIGTFLPRAGVGTDVDWVTELDLNGATTPLRMDIWNVDNRVRIGFTMFDTGAVFAWTANAIRQWRADINAQLEVVTGLEEDYLQIQKQVGSVTTSGGATLRVGTGLDSVVAFDVAVLQQTSRQATRVGGISSVLARQIPLGFHFLAWLQQGNTASGTSNWVTVVDGQTGFDGVWMC